MGKRKDIIHPRFLAASVNQYNIHKKKHKKHKKHKKRHHYHRDEVLESAGDLGMMLLKPPQLKLKIKLGGQTLGTKSVPTFTVLPDTQRSASPLNVETDDDADEDDDDDDDDDDVDDDDEDDDDEEEDEDVESEDSDDDVPAEGVPIEQYRAWLDEDSNLEASPLPEGCPDSSPPPPLLCRTRDEEEIWLEALERGELDENGEMKKEIDESLLTTRQKALLHKQQLQPLLELPMGHKQKEVTAEMLQKREERALKRRQQAARKAEENKNQTIERLTKTSRAKIKSLKERRAQQNQVPMVRYSSSSNQGTSISYPSGVPVPAAFVPMHPPVPVNCGVSGCGQQKRYSCSKTGTPLCSLECYKKNLLLLEAAA
ncbi:hypothetical protein DNTS_022864 [Danionella cerebrum]|uniref:INO80 complex subunit B-like conserved region domain-containing protein n=1 Tax=Danionella cerebrum TaxID=2873325 RepID=A0A553QU98_9TELE|nr:hypothetical protein DNTS_022864 [Danionella translucida]TRY93540.1 hypothetical protein DNTS_022864 [Danionella translucida]